MLRHVALFRWRPGTTEEQVRAVEEGLARLPGLIPEIRDYRFGPDAGLREGNYDFAVVADFDDVEAWRRYVEHPDHQAVLTDLIRPIAESRHSVQFELPE